MRLAWASDVHLNFLHNGSDIYTYIDSIRAQADALVITGDIDESTRICETLGFFDTLFDKPVYFVLGNHDFYYGSIKDVRRMVSRFAYSSRNLHYLSNTPTIELSKTTALLGHDGWADGRLGDLEGSDVILNDFSLIEELNCWKRDSWQFKLDKVKLRLALEKFGDEAAKYLALVLYPAVNKYKHVIVATHIPPFREAAWHEGKPSDDNFLPYFACKAIGDVLLAVALENPKCQITVLCGHTHSGGEVDITPNLKVITAPSQYGKPLVHHIFTI
ncbi:MAG: metallophosphoesterase [Candidatus Paceibacterota bacterium]|jgi:3',5'-cyclic AMP phosphodiesterase CpdA